MAKVAPVFRPLLLFAFFLALPQVRVASQTVEHTSAPDDLFRSIKSQDAALFDAYNRCDFVTLGNYVSDDLEFYHDKSGLAVGRQQFVDNTKKYICGKVQRELVQESLEVYPLDGYGAVEMGTHRFHHPGKDNAEPLGEARFVMLWHNDQGKWKLTRVISYSHGSVAK